MRRNAKKILIACKFIPIIILLTLLGYRLEAQPFAYVTNYNSNSVSVIDIVTNAVIATIPVGQLPNGIAVSPNGAKVYVTNSAPVGSVSVINTETNMVIAMISVGNGPFGIAINPDGSKVYVANNGSHNVTVIDAATNSVLATISVGFHPSGVAISPDGLKLYVANNASDDLTVINTIANTVITTIPVGNSPYGVVVSPDGSKLFVANCDDYTVRVINTLDYSTITNIGAGNCNLGITVSPDGTKIYVSSAFSNQLTILDAQNYSYITAIQVGNWPYGVSVTPDGAKVYVSNFQNDYVSVINTVTNSVDTTIVVGSSPLSFGKSILNTAYCDEFTDLAGPSEELDAANCLCEQGYIQPQFYSTTNYHGVNPTAPILRADLAKLVYYAIYKGNAPSPAESFPVPFADLQQSGDPYFKYAKALSCLQYGDQVTPFDRDFINFRPFENIQVRYSLKVLLEAYDIPPENTNGGVILGLNPGDDGYGYVHEAINRNLIPNTITNATVDMIRGDMFIILYRLLSSCGSACDETCENPNPQPADYFDPGNFTPFNMGRNIGISEGYFQGFTKTSFNIPGIKLPMTFTHLYNSFLTQLPEPYLKMEPLGRGWSHSYNAYILRLKGWANGNSTFPDKYIVFWPDAGIHYYNTSNLQPESYGVYDEMEVVNSTDLMIKKQNQVKIFFKKYVISPDTLYLLEKIQDRNSSTITLVHEVVNNLPRIDKVIDTGGRVMDFTYSAANPTELVSVTDVAGNRTISFEVDANGNMVQFTNAKGDLTQYGYGPTPEKHLLYTVTLPEGNIVNNTYNPDNNRLTGISIPNAGNTQITVNSNYGSGQNYESTVTDPVGTLINNEFGPHGLPVSKNIGAVELNLLREVATDPTLVTEVNYEGLATEYAYDSEGRVTQITLPTGLTHTFTYTALNDIKTYKNPRNFSTTYNYDGNGNIDNMVDKMGFVTDFTVDNNGLVSAVTNPEGITRSFTYDAKGNLKTMNEPLGITSTMDYDSIGRMVKLTNPKGQVTEYEYDVLDLTTKVTRKSTVSGGDILTLFHYNQNELLDTITNALGGKTIFNYNGRDLLSSMKFGDDTKTFTYRDDDLLETYQKPDGFTFQYQYDVLGRETSDGYVSNYAYDSQNNVTGITKDGNTLDLRYDELNRLDTVIYDSYLVSYEYDANGNVTKIRYPEGFEVNYTFDANDRMTSVSWGNKTIDYTYLDDGRLERVDLPNGTFRHYNYDAAGRMIKMYDLRSTADTICAYTFTLDPLGNHLSEWRNEPLCEPVLTTNAVNYTYNDENEILTAGSSNFTHDANGNRVLKDDVTYTWDDMDKLTGFGSNSYEYDGLGLRREVTKNGQVKKYIWDVRGMGKILAETDAAGNITCYYIHGLGLEARVKASIGTVSYYHYDFRGSTVAITDSLQVITHRYSYLPFGEIVQQIEADPNPFKYVGKFGVIDEGDNVYYMRARYMDAVTGRFLSEDPVWHDNLYPYAKNNPKVLIDPNGQREENSNPLSQIVSEKIGDELINEVLYKPLIKEIGQTVGLATNVNLGAKFIVAASKILSTFSIITTVIDLGYGGDAGSTNEEVLENMRRFNALEDKKNVLDMQVKELLFKFKQANNSDKQKIRVLIGLKLKQSVELENQLSNFQWH